MASDERAGLRELEWLRRTRDLSHALTTEREPTKLLPLILDAAIEIAKAERGFLVRVLGRKRDGGYKFRAEVGRGFDKTALSGVAGDVSRTAVNRVLESDRGLVTNSVEDYDLLDASSVKARRVLSIICVPMRLRGEIKGVLYLDHRFDRTAFAERDLPVLRTFADHAALAMETADLFAERAAASERLGAALEELERLKAGVDDPPGSLPADAPRCFGQLVGASPPMIALYEEIEAAARSWDPVLVMGETGSGKGLVAREIHVRGLRSDQPLVRVRCEALEGDDFERAGRGTLVLDEVADASPGMQSRLVETLEGAGAQCRIIATSHRDLRARVVEGAFREDLYYRLDVMRIVVPPLRQRSGDAILLFNHFLELVGSRDLQLSPRARELLAAHPWPGNVRELENEVRRLAALGSAKISANALRDEIREGGGASAGTGTYSGKTLSEIERDVIAKTLAACDGNKSRTARQLGVPRSTLYHLLERYGL